MDRAQSIELTATTPTGLLDWLTLSCRHVALLAAMLATGGSLFFSEVLGWIPCELCWYQRILMYPLTVLLFVGIWRDDRKVYLYVLPLSLMGIAVSLYHYLMVMLIIPPAPCAGAVPCAFDYINIPGALSFIKIPFLALIAFVIISVMMANLALAENAPACGRLARITATVIVVATALSFIGLVVFSPSESSIILLTESGGKGCLNGYTYEQSQQKKRQQFGDWRRPGKSRPGSCSVRR